MKQPKRIYLSARYGRRSELQQYAAQLKSMGYKITSSWLDGNEQIERLMGAAQKGQIAKLNLFDIDYSDTVVVFSELPESSHSRGGRHIETGYALATGKQIITVGPLENVFSCLPEIHKFKTFGDLLRALKETAHGQ